MFYAVLLDSDVFKEKIIVPSAWLDKYNTLCLLPPTTDVAEIERQAKAQASPKHGWQMHNISFVQSFDNYSQAKENIKKNRKKPIMVDLEESGEEEEEYRQKERRDSRKRKRPQFLENYSTEMDDDDNEDCSSMQVHCSEESNLSLPDTLIVKKEKMEESVISECSRQRQQDTTNHKKSSSNCSFQLPSHSQVPESSSFNNISAVDQSKCPCNSLCHKMIFQTLAAIQRRVEGNNRLLYQIMGKIKTQTSNVNALNSMPRQLEGFPITLPARELSDLHLLNSYLSEEQNFVPAILHFTGLGGSYSRQVLKRLMESFLTKELSSKLNWKGRGDKDPFNIYTNIHNLMYHAAKRNPIASHITLADVENFIKNWLKMAPMRYKYVSKKSNEEERY